MGKRSKREECTDKGGRIINEYVKQGKADTERR